MPVNTQFVSNYNLGGINIYENPLYHTYASSVMQSDGEIIRAVNVESNPLGAKQRRAGYTTFLDTADGSQVNTIFSWIMDNGTSNWIYRFSGTTLYYFDAGAGTGTAWIPTGNGNFTGTHIGYSVLNNVLIIGDGVGSTRHSTNGTSFTNTTGAPSSSLFEMYQNRIFTTAVGGTGIVWSSANDATNWSNVSPSDSSSQPVLGGGTINKLYKLGDRLHISKTQGNVFRWDGFSLVDTATTLAPTSPYSFGTVEDTALYLNRLGIYMVDINGPQIISNPIQKYIYNPAETGMPGSNYQTAPGGIHRYNYYVAIGSSRDDLTDEPLNNAVLNYHVIKNEWLTMQFNDNPTAFHSYRDNNGSQQFLFGNATGQVFQPGGTYTADNGNTIQSVIDMIFNGNAPHLDKDWRWIWLFFNPGCEARIQVALADTFVKGSKKWIDIGQATSGAVKFHFPPGSRSKFLYLRVTDASRTARFTFYGATIGFVEVDPG